MNGVWLAEAAEPAQRPDGSVDVMAFVAYGHEWPDWVDPEGKVVLDPSRYVDRVVYDEDLGEEVEKVFKKDLCGTHIRIR